MGKKYPQVRINKTKNERALIIDKLFISYHGRKEKELKIGIVKSGKASL